MDIHSAINSFPASVPRLSSPAPSPSTGATANTSAPEPDTAIKTESAPRTAASRSTSELTDDDYQQLQLLKQRDTEVRAHEQAHIAAGGRYITSAASYDYQSGPDGRRYAIGGEVGIDTSGVSGDPAATIEKARVVRRAALAPAEPSSQDLSVAASATTMETNALNDLQELGQRQREQELQHSSTVGKGESIRTTTEAGADPAADSPVTSGQTGSADARERLEQRIAAFFAEPLITRVSQFA